MSKFAMVTGTDHGLGFELVKKLLSRGYVVFAGCHKDTDDQYKGSCKIYGNALQIVHLDISDTDSVRKAKELILKRTDHLDLLINNAGILGNIEATIEDDIDFEDVEKVIKVNALGTLKVTNLMFPLLIKGEDKQLIIISSEAGSVSDCGRNSWFGYCMSKSALNMESALIHNQFKKYGGQVLVVHPGWMKTYMRGKLDEDAQLTPDYSAECILKLTDHMEQYRGDKPVYLDYSGKIMNW